MKCMCIADAYSVLSLNCLSLESTHACVVYTQLKKGFGWPFVSEGSVTDRSATF